jgi:predicted nucleotidyltransferase
MTTPILNQRQDKCGEQLKVLEREIESIEEISKKTDLCIYVTGSFGRFDASPYSDLDLFFIMPSENGLGGIEKTLIDAELIRLVRRLGFPDFDSDGRFLKILPLDQMLTKLGSPDDDSCNYFTARMLLLLESYCLYNQAQYEEVIEKVIDRYFRDFHDHMSDFLPVFLVNDIIRFWKTLCLNYEHRRNRSDHEKIKAHLKNLKLKFSRMLTCFSMIAWLTHRKSLTHDDVKEGAALTPFQRIERVAGSKKQVDLADELKDHYSWFLAVTGRPKQEALEWIKDKDNRDQAFQKAGLFGDRMYEMITRSAEEDLLRFLLI